MKPLDYHSSGVNYDVLDEFKRHCQRSAATTTGLLAKHGVTEPAGIRGESAYLLETPDEYIAHVEEGLGTKNLVADALLKLTGECHYHAIGVDTVASIVNDLITVGALPLSIAMHAAVGNASWFENTNRARDLAEGFAEGCRQSGAVWGGGETPALKNLVCDDTIVLAGSTLGRIKPKELRIAGQLQAGDAMVFLASSGIHANGLTLCRDLASRLPQGYLTPVTESQNFAQALLAPTRIYVPFIEACQEAGIQLKYAVNLTGHGWRKLMRLDEPWIYRCKRLTGEGIPPLPIFDFIAQHAGLDAKGMYGTFNMGLGFAVYVSPVDAMHCVGIARQVGLPAWIGGVIEQGTDAAGKPRRAVEIEQLGIAFEGDSLQIRA
ncbi:AIR synthase related protein [Anatilimnocola floriformis]|uniref:AIR synthase related protein n=1 Tax=Anatilimnocola floriformis TaxID=2948575 RepID=UPI0020C400DF|nr:AIR synthase related protein [Anatilimnocola floriformis]